MKMLKGLLLVLVAMSLNGCVTRGKDFSSDLGWIRTNETTQADVSKLLGSPEKVGNSGGTPTWTYGYYEFKLFGESLTKELKLYWAPGNKVQDFAFSSSFPTDRKRQMLAK